MANYSIVVQLAWEISCFEAANKKSSFIEVDHIMLGILSLDKINQHLNFLSDENVKNFIYEKKELYNTLNAIGINITTFRRKLRDILPIGKGLPSDKVFHRSNNCKRMFATATCFADNFLTINHLFQTIIGWESSYSRQLLLTEKIDIEKLKSEIMFSFYRSN